MRFTPTNHQWKFHLGLYGRFQAILDQRLADRKTVACHRKISVVDISHCAFQLHLIEVNSSLYRTCVTVLTNIQVSPTKFIKDNYAGQIKDIESVSRYCFVKLDVINYGQYSRQ